MQTYIAENLKNLRNQKNVTQEELAAYLSISFQSVSKWERGENMPDIQTLAALANYFDVTTDELLGMEKIRGEFFTNDFYNKEHELMREKRYDELIELLQSARKVYPHNISAQWSLAIALALRGHPGDREEAVDMCRRILGDMQYDKLKTCTRSALFILTKNDMKHDEALQQVRRLTHIWDCREMITTELFNGEERNNYLQYLVRLFISVLYDKIENGPLDDDTLLRIVFNGNLLVEDTDENLRMLERIKQFIKEGKNIMLPNYETKPIS